MEVTARAVDARGESLVSEDCDEYRKILYQMLLVRRFEERAAEMYTRARIGGYTHLNIGEEATVVGTAAALEPRDYLFNGYREHGHTLCRGASPGATMAELFGKETGLAKGRGGSMHLIDVPNRFMGGYGIVGGQLPLATGVGLAIDYRGGDEVVMCAFGEGATNIGAFHESLNLSKLWRLPCVWVCSNNKYAMGAAVASDSAVVDIFRKAAAYDMAAEQVDGMDVLAVRAASLRAVRRAREQREPTLLECVTYRFRGHSMADPGRYRSPEELRKWMDRDPIASFTLRLQEAGLLTPDEYTELDRRVQTEVQVAVDFAENSPEPDPAELARYVYAETRGA